MNLTRYPDEKPGRGIESKYLPCVRNLFFNLPGMNVSTHHETLAHIYYKEKNRLCSSN